MSVARTCEACGGSVDGPYLRHPPEACIRELVWRQAELARRLAALEGRLGAVTAQACAPGGAEGLADARWWTESGRPRR